MDAIDVEALTKNESRREFLESDEAMDVIDADSLMPSDLYGEIPSELNDPNDRKEIENQVRENQIQLALQILHTELIPTESTEIQKVNEIENEIT